MVGSVMRSSLQIVDKGGRAPPRIVSFDGGVPGGGGVASGLFNGPWVEHVAVVLERAKLTPPAGASLQRGTYESCFGGDVVRYDPSLTC